MDLNLTNKNFLICGASSGFGRAVAETLLAEGARVIAVARRMDKLAELKDEFGDLVECFSGDLSDPLTIEAIFTAIEDVTLHGALINGGGPPALAALETTIDQWDDAYNKVMRWKIELSLKLIPLFSQHGYGRVLFIESQSVKQPIPNLVLSNSFRAGIVGFAKTLSQEIAGKGITVNVLAPGSHYTPAIDRVIQKRADTSGQGFDHIKKAMESGIPVGRMGHANELASLAVWLLSPVSGYVTGQTITHDGGSTQGIFG